MAVAIPVAGYRHRVRDVSASAYAERATDLLVTDQRRIGFFAGHHGGYLVRTPNVPAAIPRSPASNPAFVAAMREDLAGMRTKALVEVAFYLALFGYLFLGVPALFRRLTGSSPSWWRRRLVGGALGLLFGALVLLPQITVGYGSSAFSTYVGPYPSSYSGPYPDIHFISAETVSYRPFVEVLLKVPVTLYCSSYGSPLANPVRPLWLEVLFELLSSNVVPTRLFGALGYWGCVGGYFLFLGVVASLLTPKLAAA